jgi:hypothetical protein
MLMGMLVGVGASLSVAFGVSLETRDTGLNPATGGIQPSGQVAFEQMNHTPQHIGDRNVGFRSEGDLKVIGLKLTSLKPIRQDDDKQKEDTLEKDIRETSIQNTGIQSTSSQNTGAQNTELKEINPSVEEVIVKGDPSLRPLTGLIKDALQAFENGHYGVAERKFSNLAVREHRNLRYRRFVNQNLELSRGRRLSSSYETVDDDFPPISAPNAKAIAFAQPLQYTRLQLATSKLFYLRGVAQVRQNKHKAAIKSFKRALRVNRHNLDARIEYALTFLKVGDLKAAGKNIEKLDKVAAEKCDEKGCAFSSESKARYAQVRLAYENMLGDNKG